MVDMIDKIRDIIESHIPLRHKISNGWITFNAVCCEHNGEKRPDSKGRGQIKFNPDGGFVYYCQNCKYSTTWIIGQPLTKKAQKLLSWLGLSQEEINTLIFNSISLNTVESKEVVYENVQRKYELPHGCRLLTDVISEPNPPQNAINVATYIYNRNPKLFDIIPFLWTSEKEHMLNLRAIIPFINYGQIVGYTARLVEPYASKYKPKYFHQYQNGLLFNSDVLNNPYRNKVVVCEGVIDAMIVDGVATLTNTVTAQQQRLLNSYPNVEKIIIADKDKAGRKLIESALSNGWSVSFPDFGISFKDIDDVFKHYDRLFIISRILLCVERDPTMIAVKMEQYCGK